MMNLFRAFTRKQPPARQDALDRLSSVYRRKMALLIEKERVASDRRGAVRDHAAVAPFDARLRAINAELLAIG